MEPNYLFLKPLDTLFFRSGKPFDQGEDTWTDPSLVVPYPSVVWGALFSTLYAEGKVTPDSEDDRSKLKIKRVFLYNPERDLVLVPAPLDLFMAETIPTFFPEQYDGIKHSSHPLATSIQPAKPEHTADRQGPLYISLLALHNSYSNRWERRTQIYRTEDISRINRKVGIGLSKTTGSAEEDFLYKTEMIELLSGWGYLVEYESEFVFDEGILRLGGEGKCAYYSAVPNPPAEVLIKYKHSEQPAGYTKLYLYSPTFFSSGDGLNELGSLPGVELVSAAMGRYTAIGGFDMKENKPKAMRKAVPPGSVYLLYTEASAAHLFQLICDTLGKKNSDGFGEFDLIPFQNN